MFSPEEIDSVLKSAQHAVDTLAEDVGRLQAAVAVGNAPASSINEAFANAAPFSASRATTSVRRTPGKLDRILKLKVPIVVRLAQRSMSTSEIVKMMPGTILEFDRTVHEQLDLMINKTPIGRGAAVKVNECYGIRITSIASVQNRIDSLGSPH